MATTLIRNGRIVTASDDYVGDVLIDGEKISTLGQGLSKTGVDLVVDAKGKLVMPGGIDVHTHLDMPFGGTVSCDDFYTGHRSAAFGGTTTHVDFSIQSKGSTLRAAVEGWQARASGKAVIDYGFHVAITDLTDAALEEIRELPSLGVTSIKLFMAYKGALQVDDTTLFKCLQVAKQSGVLTMVHAENGDAIDVLIKEAVAAKNLAPIYHALTRPPELEAEATYRAVQLARAAGDAPLFVVHLTNEGALAAITEARARGQHAYAETCVQYFYFTKDNLLGVKGDKFNGAKYVCSPPFREVSDQKAIMRGIRTGDLSSVSTDHCPFRYKDQKAIGKSNFAQIPNGVPGIEDRLYMLWDVAVNSGAITPSRFVELTAANPAKLFGIYPQKGTITVGADADIVIWDPKLKHTVTAKGHHSAVDYNLYEGMKVTGKPVKVFRRGTLLVDGDKWLGEKGSGQYLHRASPILI